MDNGSPVEGDICRGSCKEENILAKAKKWLSNGRLGWVHIRLRHTTVTGAVQGYDNLWVSHVTAVQKLFEGLHLDWGRC